MGRLSMRLVAVLATLFVAAATSGCLEGLETQFSKVRGEEAPPDDLGIEMEGHVTPGYAKSASFEVEPRARSLVVDVKYTTEFDGNAAPLTPAQLTVSIVDPSGSVVASETLDPGTPSANLRVSDFTSFGTWKLELEGHGMAGNGQGASYRLVATVAY